MTFVSYVNKEGVLL